MWQVVVAVVVLSACTPSPSAEPLPPGTTAPAATATSTATTEPTATSAPVASDTASTEAPGTTTTTTGADTVDVLPDGFELTSALATAPDGTVCELCMWLADDADQRGRGLMFVTDLGPADGMAFRYPAPHTGRFWMKNTVLPLSIAFFDPTGSYIEAFDMEPCAADPCERYPTPRDFVVAVETTRGDLGAIGIVPGSTFELLDRPCDA